MIRPNATSGLPRIRLLEPYPAPSHQAWIDALTTLPFRWDVQTLPPRHFRWRMRGAGVWFARTWNDLPPPDLLVATSSVPLTDLRALAPHSLGIPTLLYFHENQLVYPLRDSATRERDLHFGFTQITSALAATTCAFNSAFHRQAFFAAARKLLQAMPDAADASWVDDAERRSVVLPIPLNLDAFDARRPATLPVDRNAGPIVLWNHRWEYDKRPDAFLDAFAAACSRGAPLRLVVLGSAGRNEASRAREICDRFGARVLHVGEASRERYVSLLHGVDVAVSTTDHEFFGIAMLEATAAGAEPLVPNRLVYPELYPSRFRYEDDDELVERLIDASRRFHGGSLRAPRSAITAPFVDRHVLPAYQQVIGELLDGA